MGLKRSTSSGLKIPDTFTMFTEQHNNVEAIKQKKRNVLKFLSFFSGKEIPNEEPQNKFCALDEDWKPSDSFVGIGISVRLLEI